MPPNGCMVVQFLHGVWSYHRFTSRTIALMGFRLYRQDKVFLYPSTADRMYAKLVDISKRTRNAKLYNAYDHLIISYYHGRLVSNLTPHCVHCEQQKREVKAKRQKNYHLRIDFPRTSQSMYVVSEGVEYPQGFNIRKDFFSTFTFDPRPVGPMDDPFIEERPWIDSKSWLSSTVYHINCSKHPKEISHWTRLNNDIIQKVCRPEKEEKSAVVGAETTILEPPIRSISISSLYTHDPSVLWTLTLTLKMDDVPEKIPLGRVLFSTTPIQMCDKDKIDQIDSRPEYLSNQPRRLHSNWSTTCAILKTETILTTTSSQGSHIFEIGYRIFENTNVLFEPCLNLINFLYTNKKAISLKYKWKFHQMRKKKGLYYRSKIKSLHFAEQEFSWEMAAAKCREYHMTLPHLQNEDSTQELMLRIQNDYMTPIYAIFVGLVTKVM